LSLDAAGRIEELDRMRSEEWQLLTSTSECGLAVQSSSLNLDSLCEQWLELRSSADKNAELLSASLSRWNLYQSAVNRLMPCLSSVEQYVKAAQDDSGNDVIGRTGSLAEAQKLLNDHQVCLFCSLKCFISVTVFAVVLCSLHLCLPVSLTVFHIWDHSLVLFFVFICLVYHYSARMLLCNATHVVGQSISD